VGRKRQFETTAMLEAFAYSAVKLKTHLFEEGVTQHIMPIDSKLFKVFTLSVMIS